MKETMYDCYLSQFGCMKRLMTNKKDILNEFVEFYNKIKPDRVYLLGSGTSYNACAAAAPFMEEVLGKEVTMITPSSFGKLYGNRPLVVAVSQSGKSTNTIKAINKAKELEAPVITLTDPADSAVGRLGDVAVHLAADNELIGPRTRGYGATVLTLFLMALEAGFSGGIIDKARYDNALTGYNDTFEKGEEYFRACQEFYDLHFDKLTKASKYVFTGKGAIARVAEEAALKVLETMCYPAFGYEYEEFLHGPVCFADEELAIFLSLSNDEDKDRMLKTADILGKITENCYIITNDSSVKREKTLLLPSECPDYSGVFTHILFGQLVSSKLTEDMKRTRHPGVKEIFESMDTKVT